MKRFFLTAVVGAILAGGSAVKAQPPAYLPGGSGQPGAGGQMMDDYRAAFLTAAMRKQFPRLGTNFTVLGPATKDYNAYSYVRGITDRWLAPEAGTLVNPFAGVDRFLGQDGYRRLPRFDGSVRPGKQKVVVYATVQPDGDIKEITSAALQQSDGSWASKVGSLALIRTSTPELLRGPSYGLAVAVYERDVNVFPAALGGR